MDEREISEAEQRNAIITTITLDISNKHLRDVPKSIKNFANIEFLYLSNNEIKCVPDFFFSSLPQLKWLDFRHNLLSSLPQSIGNHKELRTLLLQGNNITRLPIELGNVPTITGLNIAGNPLEYPPQNVLQEGTSSILKFLRQQLLENSLLLPELVDEMGDLELGDNEGYIGAGIGREAHTAAYCRAKPATAIVPTHRSAVLLPRTPSERRWSSSDTIITTKARLPKTRRKLRAATPAARARHSDYYIQKAMQEYEEKRMVAIQREENSKTEMIVQRMRDREALKQWRDTTLSPKRSVLPRSRGRRLRSLKRLGNSKKIGSPLEELINYINTQILVLKTRETKLRYASESNFTTELLNLRSIIERKEIELMELKRKRDGTGKESLIFQRTTSLESTNPSLQRSRTEKELALRRKIKDHATKLRDYHKSDTKIKTEAIDNLNEARGMKNNSARFGSEYRFKAFTGEVID